MLSYYSPPAASAGVFRTARFVKYLPEFGWKPLVVAVSPDALHHQRLDSSLNKLIPERTVVVKTSVLRPYNATARTVNSLFRRGAKTARSGTVDSPQATESAKSGIVSKHLLRLFRTAGDLRDLFLATPDAQIGWMIPAIRAALPLIRQHRPRVIYSSGPPHSSHLIAVALKRLTGLPIVIDLRDPWARTEWDSAAPRSARGRTQSCLEKVCVSAAAGVILNTRRLRDEFQISYNAKFHWKFHVVPNGFDPDLRIAIQQLITTPNEVPSGKVVRLCHPGRIYGRRTLRPLITAIGKLTTAGRRVVLEQIGGVEDADALSQYVREHLPRGCVQFRGQLAHDVTLERMASADILVVVQPDTSIQIPGKLFEMLPFQKPLLALTQPGATADVVEQFRLGRVVDPHTSDAIAAAICQLADGQQECTGVANWESALHEFDGRHLAGRFAGILSTASSRGGARSKRR